MDENEEGDTHGPETHSSIEQPTINLISESASPDENKSQQGADDAEHVTNNKMRNPSDLLVRLSANEFLTLVVAVSSLAVSIVSCQNAADTSDIKNAVANLSRLEADTKRQADLTAVVNRPWIKVFSSVESDLTIDPVEGRVTIGISYKNVGNSPATHVVLWSQMYLPTIDQPDAMNEQHKLCESRKSFFVSRKFQGAVMFPQDITQENTSMIFRMTEAGKFYFKTKTPSVIPIIIGCVDYRFLGETEHHQTGFIWRLVHVRNINPDTGLGISLSDAVIPQSDLGLDKANMFGVSLAD